MSLLVIGTQYCNILHECETSLDKSDSLEALIEFYLHNKNVPIIRLRYYIYIKLRIHRTLYTRCDEWLREHFRAHLCHFYLFKQRRKCFKSMTQSDHQNAHRYCKLHRTSVNIYSISLQEHLILDITKMVLEYM